MGLDMYLSRRLHIANYDFDKKGRELAHAVCKALNLDSLETPYNNASIKIDLPAAYWRKANAIHAWFVDNVQGGEDTCNEYEVSRHQLITLRDLCQKILSGELDSNVLPPRGGFFFGSIDVDDGYRQDLEDTVTQINAALSAPNITDYDTFVYQSSW